MRGPDGVLRRVIEGMKPFCKDICIGALCLIWSGCGSIGERMEPSSSISSSQRDHPDAILEKALELLYVARLLVPYLDGYVSTEVNLHTVKVRFQEINNSMLEELVGIYFGEFSTFSLECNLSHAPEYLKKMALDLKTDRIVSSCAKKVDALKSRLREMGVTRFTPNVCLDANAVRVRVASLVASLDGKLTCESSEE